MTTPQVDEIVAKGLQATEELKQMVTKYGEGAYPKDEVLSRLLVLKMAHGLVHKATIRRAEDYRTKMVPCDQALLAAQDARFRLAEFFPGEDIDHHADGTDLPEDAADDSSVKMDRFLAQLEAAEVSRDGGAQAVDDGHLGEDEHTKMKKRLARALSERKRLRDQIDQTNQKRLRAGQEQKSVSQRLFLGTLSSSLSTIQNTVRTICDRISVADGTDAAKKIAPPAAAMKKAAASASSSPLSSPSAAKQMELAALSLPLMSIYYLIVASEHSLQTYHCRPSCRVLQRSPQPALLVRLSFDRSLTAETAAVDDGGDEDEHSTAISSQENDGDHWVELEISLQEPAHRLVLSIVGTSTLPLPTRPVCLVHRIFPAVAASLAEKPGLWPQDSLPLEWIECLAGTRSSRDMFDTSAEPAAPSLSLQISSSSFGRERVWCTVVETIGQRLHALSSLARALSSACPSSDLGVKISGWQDELTQEKLEEGVAGAITFSIEHASTTYKITLEIPSDHPASSLRFHVASDKQSPNLSAIEARVNALSNSSALPVETAFAQQLRLLVEGIQG